MKKFFLLLAVVIFIVFAALGFQAAAQMKPSNNQGRSINEIQQPLQTQHNYLLIHVADLKEEKPGLVAVWAAFVYYSDPPQVMFLSLLPSYDEELSTSIMAAIIPVKNGIVNSQFIARLEKAYEITTDGFIIVDDVGLSYGNQLLTGDEIRVSTGSPQSTEEKRVVLYNGQEFFEKLCNTIGQETPGVLINRISWRELIPLHFGTNLSFEHMALASEAFSSADVVSQCFVLSNE